MPTENYQPQLVYLTDKRLDKLAKDIVNQCKKDREQTEALYKSLLDEYESTKNLALLDTMTKLLTVQQSNNDKLIKIFTSAHKTRIDTKKEENKTKSKGPAVVGGREKEVTFESLRAKTRESTPPE